MRELFDINLLSEIKGLDKKLSVSHENVTLKRQTREERRNKVNKQNAKKSAAKPKRESFDDDGDNPTINITV